MIGFTLGLSFVNMTITYKDHGRSAEVGGKGKTEKASWERVPEKRVKNKGTLQEFPHFPLLGKEHPSQASEAVIGLSECLDELGSQKVKFATSNRFLLLQQPTQPSCLTLAEPDQTTSINNRVDLMSDSSKCTEQQQEGLAFDEPKSRSDAVTLLRARTASRSSLTKASCPVDSSLQQGPVEPATSSKKGKRKGKKKYQKLDLATIAPNVSPSAHRRSSRISSSQSGAQISESRPQNKEHDLSTVSPSTQNDSLQNIDSPSCTNDTGTVDYSAAVKGTNYPDKPVSQAEESPQTQNIQVQEASNGEKDKVTRDVPANQSKSAKSNKKGKRRVAKVDPVTGDEIPEEAQGKSCSPASITAIADVEKGVKGIALDPSTDESSATATTISTPPRPTQSTRRSGSTHMKEKLSPIQEASGDTDTDIKNLTSETRSLLTSTPKSSTTIWSNFGLQATPQSDRSTGESSETGHRHQESSSKSQGTASGHTHPGSPAGSEQSTLVAPNTHGTVSRQKPTGFFWQLDSHGFPCAKMGCDKRCNLWDGVTVICPRCGPYSEFRYCCKEHLFEDVKWHWLYCGQMTFEHPCRETSIPRDVREGPVMVPCLHPYDTPERHRQAVRFSSNARTGDYFIFSDWADFVEAEFPENNLDVRCSHRVVYVVRFDDPAEKDRFRRVLATCLFLTIDVHELVDYLFRLIRDKLRSEGRAQEFEVALKYQFHSEFSVTIQDRITGTRHACETDWNGKNRRNCPDSSCRAEYRRLLGSPPGRGHSHLIDHLEGTYWILRTARTTHPNVSSIIARMRGEGFDQVADEDQRVFRRGEGWDGAGTGEMEIEGMNA